MVLALRLQEVLVVSMVAVLLAAGLDFSVEEQEEQEEQGEQEEVAGAGTPGCPGLCQCEVQGLLHRLDCSDLGLSEIPANLSGFTSYLRLAGNDLTDLPEGAFSGLYNLRVL
ncbi:hypothetical protein NHX12_020391 [Muraenolepis orangiensis]|uniref:LRRNT domain-containing protein n=1 Tax=Muraenolepis orangiensis TaxID=630683 RepID=A0A9Q0IUZ5_9TELE|nr:hypothetical protein NHX12_020391 [Muraenolepis orangiensis]